MGHCITAIVLQGDYNTEVANQYDLHGKPLGYGLTLFHIDHVYTACWQKILRVSGELEWNNREGLYPTEKVSAVLMEKIAATQPPRFAIILTDYFGGIGDQCANVYEGQQLASREVYSINQALAFLGVQPKPGMDAFDSVGLDRIRSQPDYLDRYGDLAEELGV